MLDMKSKEVYNMGEYYGDPELALTDKQGAFAVVVGSDHLGIFDMTNKKLELRDIDIPEWIVSLNQEEKSK